MRASNRACPICGDPQRECWDNYKGIDDSAPTYVNGDPVSCPMWERDLLARIEAIETVDQLRDCIVWYCDPNPSGGILHLTLEEGGYTDEIIRWQLEHSRAEGREDALGYALGEKLLQFTPDEREWANRWEHLS